MHKTIALVGAVALCGCSGSFSAGSGKPSSPDGKPAQDSSDRSSDLGSGKPVGSTDTDSIDEQSGTAPSGGSGSAANTEMAAKGAEPAAKKDGPPDCIPGKAKGHEKDKAQGEAKGHDRPPCPDEPAADDKAGASDKASDTGKAKSTKKK
jgi:hypothetical protein